MDYHRKVAHDNIWATFHEFINHFFIENIHERQEVRFILKSVQKTQKHEKKKGRRIKINSLVTKRAIF